MKKVASILFILCLMLTVGCGEQGQEEEQEPTKPDIVEETETASALNVTVEGYEALALTMTYEQVCTVLGKEGEPVPYNIMNFPGTMPESERMAFDEYYAWGPDEQPWYWSERTIICACFIDNKLMAKSLHNPTVDAEMDPVVSLESFRSIEFGSDYQKVTAVTQNDMRLYVDYVDKTQHVIKYGCGEDSGWSSSFEFSNDKLNYKAMFCTYGLGFSAPMSWENYERMEVGMTYDEVCAIAGSNGEFNLEIDTVDMSSQIYCWNVDGQASFHFENGILVGFGRGGAK